MKHVNSSVPKCLENKPSYDDAKIQTSGTATFRKNGKRTRVPTSGKATQQKQNLKSNQTRPVLKKLRVRKSTENRVQTRRKPDNSIP